MRSRERQRLSDELAAARQRIGTLEAELSRLSQRDRLIPSLLSLGAFRTQYELDVGRADRYRRPLTVALLDIDRFRQINLEHGYTAGDAVLAAVGALIGEQTRIHDLACRMGGDEFALLLPETSAAGSLEAVNRILVELEDLEAGTIRGVSASVGVAQLDSGQKPESLLAAARAALEQARAGGGGRAAVLRRSPQEWRRRG